MITATAFGAPWWAKTVAAERAESVLRAHGLSRLGERLSARSTSLLELRALYAAQVASGIINTVVRVVALAIIGGLAAYGLNKFFTEASVRDLLVVILILLAVLVVGQMNGRRRRGGRDGG